MRQRECHELCPILDIFELHRKDIANNGIHCDKLTSEIYVVIYFRPSTKNKPPEKMFGLGRAWRVRIGWMWMRVLILAAWVYISISSDSSSNCFHIIAFVQEMYFLKRWKKNQYIQCMRCWGPHDASTLSIELQSMFLNYKQIATMIVIVIRNHGLCVRTGIAPIGSNELLLHATIYNIYIYIRTFWDAHQHRQSTLSVCACTVYAPMMMMTMMIECELQNVRNFIKWMNAAYATAYTNLLQIGHSHTVQCIELMLM